MVALKVFLAACVLYLCSSFGDASLSKVSSLTSAMVERAVASHVQRNVFGHGKQLARLKREVVTKKLEDPKGCLASCRKNESTQIFKTVLKNTARLVGLALENIKDGDLEDKSPAAEEAFKKRVEADTIKNMGPMFEDLCKVHKSSGLCYSQCPDSKGRGIMALDNQGDQAIMCEPSRNWNSFAAYWAAMTCINDTKLTKPCDGKCGPEVSVANVTKLELDDDESAEFGEYDDAGSGSGSGSGFTSGSGTVTLKYETSSTKNSAAAATVCKGRTCQIDCYKPIMTKKCDAKSYDMYSRMSRVEPHGSLGILKLLGAIDVPADCKAFL